MNATELNHTVNELRELRRMSEELSAQMDALKDALRAHMVDTGATELNGQDWKISYKTYETTRFDSKAFRKDHAAMASKYTKTTTATRLTIA